MRILCGRLRRFADRRCIFPRAEKFFSAYAVIIQSSFVQRRALRIKTSTEMKKLGLLLLFSVMVTAVTSTLITLHLASRWMEAPVVAAGPPAAPAQLVNYKATTINAPDGFIQTCERVTPAVVNITSFSGGYRTAGGSGVIISSDGYIITNFHVVEGSNRVTVTFNNRRELPAKVIGADPTTDLALIKVTAEDLDAISFGDSDEVQVGEWVLAIGNPFNLASTVTAGIVSAKARNINILQGAYSIESFIQTDAVVNPGNSGGALVNARGELVGINTAIITESGGYEGYSFAIPSNLVYKVVSDLREFGRVQRAILGVNIQEIDDALAADLELPQVAGVLIQSVQSGSSAEESGLRAGDVIVKVNGVHTNSVPELQEQVARFRPGDRVDLEFIRNGRLYRRSDVELKGVNEPATSYRRE